MELLPVSAGERTDQVLSEGLIWSCSTSPGAKGCSPRKHSLGGGEAVLGVRDDLDDGKDKLSTL